MSQWSCSVCTYLNHPALKSCEICEAVRELQEHVHTNSELKSHVHTDHQSSSHSHTVHQPNHSNTKYTKPSVDQPNHPNTNCIKPSVHQPNGANHPNQKKRKRFVSEIEPPHFDHHKMKTKEEHMKYPTDIIARIEHVRAGYQSVAYHNKISTLLPPGATSNGSTLASVIGTGLICRKKSSQKGITIVAANGDEYPFVVIDFKTTTVKIESYSICSESMTNWVVEGSNDAVTWSTMHYQISDIRATQHYQILEHRIKYFSKLRVRMNGPNSNKTTSMQLKGIKFFGMMRRKVYPLRRVDEYKASEPFPAIPKNKCMGDIENVFKILNESESLQHNECKEYDQDIP
eukprot:736828_1